MKRMRCSPQWNWLFGINLRGGGCSIVGLEKPMEQGSSLLYIGSHDIRNLSDKNLAQIWIRLLLSPTSICLLGRNVVVPQLPLESFGLFGYLGPL
ncbi:hypothetical protein PIB30_099460 [Stylosanthes scabra]|uniref:Uncharacterized protein n=1 Tax=Stylosanthes scabra TaxID=79078 RepID=A0ABU6UX49_9FABA|nr:hypothetical protein [Stylosanthes scabra]